MDFELIFTPGTGLPTKVVPARALVIVVLPETFFK